ALQPVLEELTRAGLYAYLTVDDASRWTVASDTEFGRIDVRVGADGYELEVWDTSPGLFWEEEEDHRREAFERLARVSLPKIARGLLDEGQEAWWDEFDHGVGVRIRAELPFARREQIAAIARYQLERLNDVLALLERRLVE
ncbi:MAG TPA: hypothetical protein VHA53_09705, partial [Nitrolancea sp.]|nr:hypothetical protein [Nitrolancea sp.]